MESLEIITTGNEVLHGEIVNGNAAWLADACRGLAFDITRHVTVADDPAAISLACQEAAARADVVIVTGGLGPTSDDLTLSAAAKAFGVETRFHEDLWQEIQEFFLRAGRECAETNQKQAILPEGGRALKNLSGTAPGVTVAMGGATFFFLPGVPSEMRQIFGDHVAPWLEEQRPQVARQLRTLRCFGLPEASLGERLETLTLDQVLVGYRVIFPEIMIKLSASGRDPADVATRLADAEDQVRALLGDLVIGSGNETLAGVVGGLLLRQKATVALAESCTGGLLGNLLTDTPGASAYFHLGVIAYSNAAKVDLLGVSRQLLSRYGAVSREVAQAMAEGVRCRAETTHGIGITGIAGPSGGSPEKPVGTVYIALAGPEKTMVRHERVVRARTQFKQYVVAIALDMLRKALS